MCQHNIAASAEDRCALARERILADAGGELQRYERQEKTDALVDLSLLREDNYLSSCHISTELMTELVGAMEIYAK